MAFKSLKDVLGKYGELSPEGERKFANLHGPVKVTDPENLAQNDKIDSQKQTKYPTAPKADQLSKQPNVLVPAVAEETELEEDDHGSHHIKVMRGSNGKFAAFRVYQDGHKQKVSAWYSDRSEANLSAGLKESFATFATEAELVEGFDDEQDSGSAEQLDENFKENYREHHAKALSHLVGAAAALKKHKTFMEKGGLIHSWHAGDMKHTARQLEDLKDSLNHMANNAEENFKLSQQKPRAY